MTNRAHRASWLSAIGTIVLLLCGLTLSAQEASSPVPTIRQASSFRVSLPLRDLAKRPTLPNYRLQTGRFSAQQTLTGGGSNFSIGVNGIGLGSGFSEFTPDANYPDDNIAVGGNNPAQIVQVVNNSVVVFDKSLNALTPPVPISELLGEFGGACSAGTPIGHPIAQYDRAAGQWLIAETVVTAQPYFSTACIGVSSGSDATGGYNLYQFPLNDVTGGYMDLPKWGVMPSGFFQSNDNFGGDGKTFQGAYECAYDRAAMETGGNAAQVCFQLTTSDFALLPADLDSPAPPPANQDEFLFSLLNSSNLALYSFHTDWTDPTKAFMTGSGASQLFSLPSFTPACNGVGLAACVPQLNTPILLDVLGDRLLYRVAYYDDIPAQVPKTALPPHYQHWLILHDSTASGGNTAETWYELYATTKSVPVTSIRLLQSGTYAPDSTNHRWMGSIARDKQGNILMGYSISSSSIYPSIAITGRLESDPLGTMEDELHVIAGSGSYSGVFDFDMYRWGDYTSMRLDPADGCTLWYTNEYYTMTGTANWSTQINSARFSGCE